MMLVSLLSLILLLNSVKAFSPPSTIGTSATAPNAARRGLKALISASPLNHGLQQSSSWSHLQMLPNHHHYDNRMEHGHADDRRRKRDILRHKWQSLTQRNPSSSSSSSSSTRLQGWNNNKNGSNNGNNSNNNNTPLDLKEKWEASVQALQASWQALVEKAPPALRDVVEWLLQKLHDSKFVLMSFAAGSVLTLGAILVPIYSTVETLTQPVTLFETILGDLEQAYVEPVDTQKLFETGVSAMLRSLDPYTEFEGAQEATALTESIQGKYGGVGLVIAGGAAPKPAAPAKAVVDEEPEFANEEETTLQQQEPSSNENKKNNLELKDGDISSSTSTTFGTPPTLGNPVLDKDNVDDSTWMQQPQSPRSSMASDKKGKDRGIRVISAFEGYAFDYGLRVGDRLLAVDDEPISGDTSVEQVRNHLRGEPGTLVSISFERDGVDDVQTVTMPRSIVRIRDVKVASLLGRPTDGLGYIQLSGFTSESGREVRQAIRYLQQATEDATNGERTLQGLILDLRNNPGGLLTSAVDVASLLVPKGSDIVSARGRGFPGILYRSRVEPLLDQGTKLAVLVNGNTASAAEIVSGAVQDLDAGIIVGSDRTFGKGLVQNVEELPFDTALKFTVAKYYTPSGRCIQGVNYSEGGGLREEDGGFQQSKVAEKDRETFYTKSGRIVRDGGGIESDFKVEAPKASALEVTLLRSGVLSDFAAEWSKKNELTSNFDVDEGTYRKFQAFVDEKQRTGQLQLEALYDGPLEELKKSLKKSGYKGSEKEVANLQARIVQEVKNDFEKYRSDIKEDISTSILARYLPESMLLERTIPRDKQVQAAVKLLSSDNKFNRILAKGTSAVDPNGGAVSQPPSSLNLASGGGSKDAESEGHRASVSF